jgi:hypothetical protein
MADIDSGLPIRSQLPSQVNYNDIIVKVGDATSPTTQQMAVDSSGRVTVKLDDSAGNGVTSQVNGSQRALDIGIDVGGVQIDPRQIRALTASDIVTVDQGTANTLSNAWPMEITDGTHGPAAVKAASTAAVATDPALVVALSPNSPLPIGTNALGSVLANLQVANAAVTSTNPVPVTITSSSPGTPVQAYNTSAAVAAGSSVTFTYTVAATHTFSLQRVWSSASGKIKVVVNNNGSPIFVGFNSTANPNIDITIMEPPTIVAAATVTVVITNEDLLAQDVYSTIEGNQN